MIAFLEGILAVKHPTQVQINVHGVGYEITIPVSTYDQLPDEGQKLALHTAMIVREDSMQLYGFASLEEKQFFLDLIAISGVGPKVATGILSGANFPDFRQAIVTNNITRLKGLPGIGKKTAERLVLEMKDKYARSTIVTEPGAPQNEAGYLYDDAMRALISLGYAKAGVIKILDKIMQNNPPDKLEQLIKEALRRL